MVERLRQWENWRAMDRVDAEDRGGAPIPPFSPVLLAGFALRALPLAPLQAALNAAMSRIRRHHPELFERLSGLDAPLFLIDPVDLPVAFVLAPDPDRPRLTAIRDVSTVDATATIRGPLMALIELLEGRSDGDALFFSRRLVVEGDTESVVALRNAVDDAEIDLLASLMVSSGPLAAPARKLARGVAGLLSIAARDFETVRSALIAPAMRQNEIQAARLAKIHETLDAGVRQRRRQGTRRGG